jgi:outer membrane autotransporter protein
MGFQRSDRARRAFLSVSMAPLLLLAPGICVADPSAINTPVTFPPGAPNSYGGHVVYWENPSGGAFSGNNYGAGAPLYGTPATPGPNGEYPPCGAGVYCDSTGVYINTHYGSLTYAPGPMAQDTVVLKSEGTGAPSVSTIPLPYGPYPNAYNELPAGTKNYSVSLGSETVAELDLTSTSNVASGAAPSLALGGAFAATNLAAFQTTDGSTPITVTGSGSLLSNALQISGNMNVTGGILKGYTTTIDVASSSFQTVPAGRITNSTLTMTGSGSMLMAPTSLYIGETSNTTATLDLEGGASAATGNVYLALGDTGTNGKIIIDGSTMATTNGFGAIGYNGTGTLTITGGGSWTLNGASGNVFVSGIAGSKGYANVSGAGSRLSAGGYIIVGQQGLGFLSVTDDAVVRGNQGVYVGNSSGSNAAGTMQIAEGGRVFAATSGNASSYAAIVGGATGATGTVTIDGSGSLWSVAQSMRIGADGSGKVTISDGGKLEVDGATLEIGSLAGGSGALTIDGSGSTLALPNGAVIVGSAGAGRVTLLNGALLDQTNQTLVLGSQASGDGVIQVQSGSTFDIANLTLGRAGIGELDIGGADATGATTGGTVNMTGAALAIGQLQNSTGILNITGTSTFNFTGVLQDGLAGSGTISLQQGASLSTASMVLGIAATGNGSLLVGQGASLKLSSNLTVGGAGTGSLTLNQGGMATVSGALAVGQASGSTGTVTIDGSNGQSKLTVTGALGVGQAGTGTVKVANGGELDSNTYTTVGGGAGTANLTVTDAGSKFVSNGANFLVAQNGMVSVANGAALTASALTVSNGGQVTVDGAGTTLGGANGVLPTILVGNDQSSFSVSTGAKAELGALTVTSTNNTPASANFSGSNTVVTLTANATIGAYGTLAITNGAQLSFAGQQVLSVSGSGTSGTANLILSQAQTTLDAPLGELDLGFNGMANVMVIDGATVNLNLTFVNGTGPAVGSTVTLSNFAGGLTSWKTNQLSIGGGGMGAFNVGQNTFLTANNVFLGSLGSGVASLNVDFGTASVSGNIQANGGVSTITLAQGAHVTVGGSMLLNTTLATSGTTAISIDDSTLSVTGGIFNANQLTLSNNAQLTAPSLSISGQLSVDGTSTISGLKTLTSLGANFTLVNAALQVSQGVSLTNGIIQLGSAGTLTIGTGKGAAAGNFVVNSGSYLTGTGTIYGSGINGGSIHIGDDPGKLTITGNYQQTPAGTLEIEVGPNGFSQLIVGGAASLAGTLSFVSVDGGMLQLGRTYDVVTAAGGVTGAFSTIESGSPFVSLAVASDANGVLDLTAQHTAGSFAALARTRNQAAVAGALDFISMGTPTNAAATLAGTLLYAAPAAVHASFDQLSGEAYASVSSVLVDQSQFVRDAALNRVRAAFGDVGASATSVVSYTAGGPVPALPAAKQGAIWGTTFGAVGHVGGDGDAASLSESASGILIGADLPMTDTWRVGVLAGYSRSSFDVSARASSASSENYHLSLYGGGQWGDLGLQFGAAYTWHDISMDRGAAFAGSSETLDGRTRGDTGQLFGELGRHIDVGGVAVEPFGGLALVALHVNGFAETGGAAALTGDAASTDAAFSTLGLRAAKTIAFDGMIGTFSGMIGWRRDFSSVTPTAIFTIADSDPFTVAGLPIAQSAAVVETGFNLPIGRGAALGLSYRGQFGGRVTDQSLSADVSWRF